MDEFAMKAAPQGFVYLPEDIARAVPWKSQKQEIYLFHQLEMY